MIDVFGLGVFCRQAKTAVAVCLAVILLQQCALPRTARGEAPEKQRRILYNSDGGSCVTVKKGGYKPGPVSEADMRAVADELTGSDSQVDTLLVCVNAQVTYYPSKAGTMVGSLLPAGQRKKNQRVANLEAFHEKGIDPYAVILARAKERGLEALLSYRMNDAHAKTEGSATACKLWLDHPEYRLGSGLDFGHEAVRDYTFRLIEEAVQRYDCDGIELDFNRHPTFFKKGVPEAERVAATNALVERVRKMIDAESGKRGRRLVLAARVHMSPLRCGRIGLDPAAWAKHGWIDFLTVSRFLRNNEGSLDIEGFKKAIPDVPIYGCIEFGAGCGEPCSREDYRAEARKLWADGVDGIYLFNFFCSREYGDQSWEPYFFLLDELGDPETVKQ